jgi:hypothetical protein
MSKRLDEKIEKALKEASDNFNIPFEENDWVKMELKLDQLPSSQPNFWRNKGLYIVCVIMTISAISFYIGYKVNERINHKEMGISEAGLIVSSFQGTTSEKNKIAEATDLIKGSQSVIEDHITASDYMLDSNIAPSNNNRKAGYDVSNQENTRNNDLKANYQQTNPKIENWEKEKIIYIEPVINVGNERENTNGIISRIADDENPLIITGNKENYTSLNPSKADVIPNQNGSLENIETDEYTEQEQIVEEDEAINPEKILKNRARLIERFSLQLTISPDFSTTKFLELQKPGTLFGAAINFTLIRQLEIQSGVFKSRKIYSAAGSEYKAGNYTDFPYNFNPESATGECSVIEIPVNLRYTFIKRLKHKIFIGTGISSYLMQSEFYSFSYSGYYNKPLTYEYSVERPGNHIFGVLNFSIGAEYRLSPKLGVQIEPFARLPLIGIGAGSLNLITKGAQLNLIFSPFNKQ